MGLDTTTNTTGNLFRAYTKLERAKKEVAYVLASKVVERVKRGILSQEFALKNKSPSWAKKSYDPRPLVHTMQYVKELKAVRVGDGAGIKGNILLARWMEFGTKSVPARPHWRPAIESLNRDLEGLIGKEFMNGLFGD
jgi:hypothetical protein